MLKEELGRIHCDGETIVNEGDREDCMYVIQSGKITVLQKRNGKEVFLAELGEGDFFGEMALFGRGEVRSATVCAKGEVRVLTVDKKTLLRRIIADPTLAFRIIENMSSRIRQLDHQISRIKASDRRNWDTRPEEPPG
ncbi:MAG: cyclic nucleotide-binding domain-containing protein [Proteobacteria bacterium]|nr:cyclic nucleotide-binding domain-containing protein [Pseudomonadota bacterium]